MMKPKKKARAVPKPIEQEEEPDEDDEEEEEEQEEDEKELPKMPTPPATRPKPLTQQEVLVVAEDYLVRSIELIRYARGLR